MKPILLLPFVLTLPVFAGTSAKEAIAPAPAPNPCLLSWFAGGSVGYLTELEEPMYNLHVGITDSCWVVGGFNISTFLEVGYTQKDEDFNSHRRGDQLPGTTNGASPDLGDGDSFSLDDLSDALQYVADYTGYDTSYDLQIVPITLNVKFDRALTSNLNAYIGGGLGVAWVDLDLDLGPVDLSDSDWVFTAQIFAGLSYNFTPNFQMYGGARWIYYQDPDFSDGGGSATLDLDNDWLLEIGARYKF